MKLIKSLLLGSAAGIAAVAGAQAADLPMTKAAPVDYVRICSVHGAGFFYIPGSDTCIKLAGRVRAEFMYQEPLSARGAQGVGLGRNRDTTGFRGRGQLDVDARTSSEYGTIRAYFRFQLTRDSGVFRADYAGPQGSATNSNLDKAFIQFAGITAGVAQSFFDFYASAANFASAPGTSMGSDNGSTQLMAYTATFGSGFTGTIAIEDRNQRNVAASYYEAAGQRMPDVVAALRVDQNWGSAQLSGAVRQLNSSALYGFNNGSRVDSEWGYAIQAGVKINLPALAAGDVLWLQAAYADGALNYLGLTGPTLGNYTSAYLPTADAVLVNGQIEKTKGWNALANLTHYWMPTLRSTLFGSFWQVDYGSQVTNNTNIFRDYKIYQAGTGLIWSPVKAMDIGVEVLYAKFDPSRRANDSVYVKGSEDQWQGRIRFQRDF